jgi:RNA polymerase sigma-70 factor, ECF subfamily
MIRHRSTRRRLIERTGELRVREATSLSDEDLIRRFVETGAQAAFVDLMNRHLLSMRRVLYGVLNGNREDMADVEQDILVALCTQLARFRFQSSFSTYLHRFTRNKAIDFVRAQGRRRRLPTLLVERLDERDAGEDRSLDRIVIQQVLAALPERDRILFVLKEIEGRPLEEISSVTGQPVGTIKSRLFRARKRMLRMLEEGDE